MEKWTDRVSFHVGVMIALTSAGFPPYLALSLWQQEMAMIIALKSIYKIKEGN